MIRDEHILITEVKSELFLQLASFQGNELRDLIEPRSADCEHAVRLFTQLDDAIAVSISRRKVQV